MPELKELVAELGLEPRQLAPNHQHVSKQNQDYTPPSAKVFTCLRLHFEIYLAAVHMSINYMIMPLITGLLDCFCCSPIMSNTETSSYVNLCAHLSLFTQVSFLGLRQLAQTGSKRLNTFKTFDSPSKSSSINTVHLTQYQQLITFAFSLKRIRSQTQFCHVFYEVQRVFWLNFCFSLNRLYFSESSFRFTEKLSTKHREFPHTLPMLPSSPYYEYLALVRYICYN